MHELTEFCCTALIVRLISVMHWGKRIFKREGNDVPNAEIKVLTIYGESEEKEA